MGWDVALTASCLAMFAGLILFLNRSQWNSFRWRRVAVFQEIRTGGTVVAVFVCLWLVQGCELLFGLWVISAREL